MLRNILDDSPDRDATDGPSVNRAPQSLSCPDCALTNFPNLSKLNKHRNTHERPYECLAKDCFERFAQRQALTRHTETKHGDARNPTKFYHCTVDGCKYSSSGRWRKRFTRPDQVKEHIKDYGHYGPHSASDRPRRPGKQILTTEAITARFEEWSVDENGDSQPRRTVQSCEYNSFKTRLWHTDVAAEIFFKGDEAGGGDGHICPVEGCYYLGMGRPDGCERVVFKTMKALLEHHRRAHESGLGPSLAMQLREKERGSTLSSTSSDSYSSRTLSVNSDSPYGQLEDLLGLGFGTEDPKVWNENFAPVPSSFCKASEGIECYCQSCCQREMAIPLRSEFVVPQLPGESSYMHFTTLYSSSSLHDIHCQVSEPTTDTEDYRFSLPSSHSTSLFPYDSLSSRSKPRVPCDFPSCKSTFRRKYEKQRHVKSVHSSATPYSCHLCDSKFRRQDKLTSHVQSKHPAHPTAESETKSMISGSSEFPSYSALSVPSFLSGRDVVPSDTLVRANSGSERWMSGIGDVFANASVVGQRNGWFGGMGWRPDSPKLIPAGTSESPICLDETPPGFI